MMSDNSFKNKGSMYLQKQIIKLTQNKSMSL